MNHYIKKCSCGRVIEQCRCMATDKPVTIVPNGCNVCKEKVTKEMGANENRGTNPSNGW